MGSEMCIRDRQNSTFTLRYLANEGIEVVTHSLGGTRARNIRFWPGTGRVMQRISEESVQEVAARETVQNGNGLEWL